jgi:cysteine desulfurase NifS
MRRKGPKGTYAFKRISWDDAYGIIAEKLNAVKSRYGAEACAVYTGRGSFELSMCDVFQPRSVAVSSASSVLFPFGSPNTMGVGALCYVSFAMIAPHVTAGGMLINMFSDIENAELIVVWGANPATDCPPVDFTRVSRAVETGAHLVVIDPRRTATAKIEGAEWIPIRSGTDGALALGMINVIIGEELYDVAFVKDWTHGFDECAAYAQHFRPQVVELITGVPADTVVSLARRIASARGAAPVMYSGLEYSDSGVQAIRATLVLWALAGQLDVPGGRCFGMKPNYFPINREGLIPNPDPRHALGSELFPVYSHYRHEGHPMALPDAVLRGRPYPVRALIILGASMLTAWPQPGIWRQTFSGLDFLVSADYQLTADAAYADIVLPCTTMYEIDSYMTYGPLFRLREKVVEPVGEARNPFFIQADLARRLGYGRLYPQTPEEMLRYVLCGSGFTPEEVRAAGGTVRVPAALMQYRKWEKGLLRGDGKPGFTTPTGAFEIASTILEEHGYNPLPVYTEPQEGPLSRPDLTKTFPLVFNSGSRVTTDFRSQFHAIPGLCRERPEPTVMINSSDAAARSIAHGDRVVVESARGRVTMRALVSDDIMQGTIDANMGGGGPVGPQAWQECNINEVTDLKRHDPISGFPVYKALLCNVRRATAHVEDRVEIDSGEWSRTTQTGAAAAARTDHLHRIYLDNNATAPLWPAVHEAMVAAMKECYGNASSIYHEGRTAHAALEGARRGVAHLLNCTARRIVFTGGGSEANNLVVKGVAFAHRNARNHIVTTAIEHPSVLAACAWLERHGFHVTYLPVDRTGLVSAADLASAVTEHTCLVSVMAANNEVGTIQPIAELARIARAKGALFHTDAVQAAGRIPLDAGRLGVDLLTMSAHKLGGPKGVGAVYMAKDVEVEPLVHGGKQENSLRAGTENVAGAVGLGRACELAVEHLAKMGEIARLRDRLEQGIRGIMREARRNGNGAARLPNTLSMTLPGVRGESLVLALDQAGVAISSGSACRSGSPEPSHVLLALGLPAEEAHCSIRLSLGPATTEDDIDQALERMATIIRTSHTVVRFVPCR